MKKLIIFGNGSTLLCARVAFKFALIENIYFFLNLRDHSFLFVVFVEFCIFEIFGIFEFPLIFPL